jgi:protein TonB
MPLERGFATPPPERRLAAPPPERGFAAMPLYRALAPLAILISLLLHVLLAWLILRYVVEVPPPPRVMAVELVRLPPPPPLPRPVAVPKPVVKPPVVVKPVLLTAPRPIIHAKAQPRPARHSMAPTKPVAPVPHFDAAGNSAGLGLDLGVPASGTGNGQSLLDGFDDSVKARIEAAKTYPPGIPYMWEQCVVEYQVTVDRSGQLVNYKLYGCGNPFIDSAARAAIFMASPFPVPPDFGGTQYTVFGSLVFKHH